MFELRKATADSINQHKGILLGADADKVTHFIFFGGDCVGYTQLCDGRYLKYHAISTSSPIKA
jgi:hypothetical protein